MRKCSQCKITKSFKDFHKNNRKQDKLRSECRDCRNEYRRNFRQINKEQFLEYEHTEEFKNKSFSQKLKREYGITVEFFNQMNLKQNGVCKVCEKPERHKTKKKLSVDHCHKTGIVRGLLCHRCNVVLGLINEDLNVLDKINSYLKKE